MTTDRSSLYCLQCGMIVEDQIRNCPKCDNRLDLQHDGSTITVDIAHHGERVKDALRKMKTELDRTKSGVAKHLRLIVGSGVIRDEVTIELIALERRQAIVSFDSEPDNPGAILIQVKP